MGTHYHNVGTADFKEINWLHRVAQMKLNLVYRIVNGSAPEYYTYRMTCLQSCQSNSWVLNLLFVFLPLKVQERLLLKTQQLSSGMNCLRQLRI